MSLLKNMKGRRGKRRNIYRTSKVWQMRWHKQFFLANFALMNVKPVILFYL